MKRLYRYSAIIGAALIIAVATPVAILEAEDTATVTVSWSVGVIQSLSILSHDDLDSSSSTVTSVYTFPVPSVEDLARGYMEELGAITLRAKSNVGWVVMVKALSRDMGASFDGAYIKPLSDFQLRASGGAYLTITNENQVLATGKRGIHDLDVDYKVLLDKDYRPGNYSVTIVYMITTP